MCQVLQPHLRIRALEEWPELFGNPLLASAGLDRLTHKKDVRLAGQEARPFPTTIIHHSGGEREKPVKLREEGQGLTEYAFILVLVAITVIAVLLLLGPVIGNVFSNLIKAF